MTVRTAGVIGGGTMGIGIAHALAQSGAETTMVDLDAERAARARNEVARTFERGVARGVLSAEEAAAAVARVSTASEIAALPAELDLIVEAVPEQLPLKHRVLASSEARAPRMLATNTSAISIDALAEPLARPERFLGLHFFNPVWASALVEIVTGARTAPSAVEEARAFVESLGKTAIVVRDAPGFASSRLGLTLGLEALRMLEAGVAGAEDIDRAMELGYRHPMGPLKLTDLVGLDVRLDIARTLQRAYGARFTPPALLERLVAAGETGKKAGLGIYDWRSGTPVPRDLG